MKCFKINKLLDASRTVMREDFFPFSPDIEDSIMPIIEAENEQYEDSYSQGVLSVRGWAIAGLIILISLVATFFYLDFQELVHETGTSFLLPVGITIGIILTIYGAFFIASHLKEFTERFGL